LLKPSNFGQNHGLRCTSMQLEMKSELTSPVKALVVVVSLSAISFLLLYSLPSTLFSWDLIALIGVIAAILALLYAALGSRATHRRRIAFLLWWILLVSEEVFSRWSTSEQALDYQFSFAAYSEAFIWLTVFITILIYTAVSGRYIRTIGSGPSRLLLGFALLCLVSCIYTPRPLFALAWAFKLLLVVVVIEACKEHLAGVQEISQFLRVTLWAYVFLVVVPLLRVLPDPSVAFVEGRINKIASPTGWSAAAGTVFLLALIFYSPSKRKVSIVLATMGLAVMIFSGGKTGLVAGIFSAILFFALQRKFATAVRLLAGTAVLAVLIFLTTPVAGYFRMYEESGQIASASGRFDLWSSAMPAILQQPIWGHGFMSSRFFAITLENITWDVGHMHNGFLEALYNTGIIGLILILLMHGMILKNLISVIRRHRHLEPRTYRIAVGCLAIYSNLLINGLFNASFGGRPEAAFMLLLGLVVVSDLLARLTDSTQVAAASADQFDVLQLRKEGVS
jgi:O-antigen ligase